MTDYIACGRVVPERIAAIVKGIAEACVEAGCALVGGETAEHPGLLEPDEYDVAGAATGVVEADRPARPRPGPPGRRRSSRWRPAGCTPTATPWSATCCSTHGRLGARPRRRRARPHPRRGAARADPDLRPGLPRAGRARPASHAMAHVTGGGLAANLARVLPDELSRDHRPRAPGRPRRSSTSYAGWAACPQDDLEATLNCGVGMVALLPAGRRRPGARRRSTGFGVHAWAAGEVVLDDDRGGRRGRVVAGRAAPRLVRPPDTFERHRAISGWRCAGTATHWVALRPRRHDRSDRSPR